MKVHLFAGLPTCLMVVAPQERHLLVTTNYRFGPLCFTTFENDAAPGNLGLYDQVPALNWVKKYISHFNGHPKRVTIAGQSEGAASVFYLMDSPRWMRHVERHHKNSNTCKPPKPRDKLFQCTSCKEHFSAFVNLKNHFETDCRFV